MTVSKNLFDLTLEDLRTLLKLWGEPDYRATQVWRGLYQHLYTSPDQFTTLPKALREKLASQFCGFTENRNPVFSNLDAITQQKSTDSKTLKTLFRLPDGNVIETVLMAYEKRRTLCVSTQSGCAMGCTFCATGQMGYFRSLSSGEICEQILHFSRILSQEGNAVTNVVLMGMGEPFHNYDASLAAIDRLNHPDGMNLGARRFTISTVGLVPMINRFAQEKRQINLAVSLHAASDDLRSSMLPINNKYPIAELLRACRFYVENTRRRITFEWALIEGVNDTDEQAQLLSERLQPFIFDGSPLCHVNAIPLNPTQKFSGTGTRKTRALAFKNALETRGIPCTIRVRRGIDIQAGCGQLAGSEINA